jgi:hypothetical protein
MNWNSTQRNQADGVRQRLLAILAAQGVLTDALLARAHDDDDAVLEIEITDFEGCLGGDDEFDDDDDDELDDDEDEEEEEAENEASGSAIRGKSAFRPGSSGAPGSGASSNQTAGKKRQSH